MGPRTTSTTTTTTTTRCDGCAGTGRWVAGPIVNGVPSREGVCFRCQGKGHQTAKDQCRNRWYDNHVRRI